MRRSLLFTGIALLTLTTVARADDRPFMERLVSRTPRPLWPAPHTMERAGYPQQLARCTAPSVTRYDQAGYIGGARLFQNNSLLARGPGAVTGPTQDGTFGTDFAGFRGHMGRVFLAPSNDPSRGYPISWNYRAEGPRVTDVFAQRPLRKAILEKREDIEERKHGGEGHNGGHMTEGGHKPEGGH